MKSFIVLFVLIILLSSCDIEEKKTRTFLVCTCEQKEKAALFVQNSIKNANNMSDEEMEDVVSQLESTSLNLYCKNKNLEYIYHNDGNRELISKLDSCESIPNF